MLKFYFTCGQSHAHHVNGVTWDKNSVLEVEAPNENAARERVFRLVGPKWAFCYNEQDLTADEITQHFPNGICTTITA